MVRLGTESRKNQKAVNSSSAVSDLQAPAIGWAGGLSVISPPSCPSSRVTLPSLTQGSWMPPLYQ